MSEGSHGADRLRARIYPRGQGLLLAGALLGLTAALATVVAPGRTRSIVVPTDAVALVNGKPLRRATVARAAALVASDRKANASAVTTDTIVKRLVEEELLVQRALAVGIVDADANVRRAIVRAMLDSIVLEAESSAPEDGELREFFRSNHELFVASPRLEVERVVFRERAQGPTPRERAAAAAAALRDGAPLDQVRATYGDAAAIALPDGPLSPSELAEYLGPTAAERLATVPLGTVTPPIVGDDGLQVLRLRSRLPAPPLTFEADRELVEAAYRKHRVDEALRDYLERLWSTADVSIAQDRSG